jgi:hypothetical protein
MKKRVKIFTALTFIIICLFVHNAYNQIIFDAGWIPDSTAYVGVDYAETAVASTPPSKLPITYNLVRPLDGMLINSGTGEITWTPDDISDGGVVIVRAENNDNESVTKEFIIHISNAIPCPGSLTAYWKLDEESGPTYEDWVGTNDATVSGNAPDDTTGIIDGAQEFDQANNEGLSVPDDPIFNWGVNDDFTIELWFRNRIPRTDSLAHVFIGRNEGSGTDLVHWWIGYLSDSTLNFIVRRNTPSNFAQCKSGKIMDTDWHHVAAVRRPSPTNQISLYVDGLLVDNDSYDGLGSGLICTEPLTIGYLQPDPTGNTRFPYNGSLDEIRIHDKALESLEIAKSYSEGLNGRPACKDGNFAPTFTSVPVDTTREEQAYSYQITARDIDVGDVVNYTVEFKPAWLNYDGGTKTLSGTPGNSDVGDDFVLIKIDDSKDTAQQEYILHIINANDDPVITSSPVLTVDEENLYSYQVTASDIDVGDNLTFSAPVKPAWLTMNSSTGLFSGTPPADDTSEYSITVRVTDDSAAFDEQSYTLDVMNVNDPPEITGQVALDVDEDNSILIELDDIVYTDVDNGPSDLILTVQNGINYTHVGNLVTPAENYHGAITVPVELSDGEYDDQYDLSVTVNSINDIPEIINQPDTVAFEGTQYIYLFEAEDNDPEDDLTYSAIKIPGWLSFNTDNNVLSGTPQFIHIGQDSVILRVTDGIANVYKSYVITVHVTNAIPYITSVPQTSIDEDDPYNYNITYYDGDPSDIVTLTWVIKPDWLTLSSNTLSGTPTNDQVGYEPEVTYPVKLRVSDGKQDSTQTFIITVTNINDAPVITGQLDTLLAYAGSSLLINLSDVYVEDVDNQYEDLSISVQPGAGYSISGDSAKISDGASGIIQVNVRVSDGEAQSTTYGVYVRVYPITGIHDLMQTDNLLTSIYPVPASEYLILEVNSNNNLNFELLSLQGQVVIHREVNSDENVIRLDINNLPSGIYIFKIYNNKLYQTGKVSIQR